MTTETHELLTRLKPDCRRVLQVGSGDTPWSGATHLLDLHGCGDDVERGGPLRVSQGSAFVQAAAEAMPFADDCMDLVVAVHVAEHVEDPDAFCREMIRVGQRGVMENPSPLLEFIFGWEHHRWLTWLDEGVVCFAPKPHGRPFGPNFHLAASSCAALARMPIYKRDGWFDVIVWEDGFKWRVYDKAPRGVEVAWDLKSCRPWW